MRRSSSIEQLAKLLAEEERVEEKIHETQVVLSDIKKRISETLVRRYVAMTQEKISMPEDLMKEEQSYERLLQALLDMKNEIAKQIRPVEEQIIQANVDHLRQGFEDEKNKLEQCLAGMDQKILDCHLHLEEYRRIRSSLEILNGRLSRLGRDSLPMPDPLPSDDLGDVVIGRVEHLKSQGKL